MLKGVSRNDERMCRHMRVRTEISGTPECPRLNIFRSNSSIRAQIIGDVNDVTLVSAGSIELELENGGNVEAAKTVGTEVIKHAIEKNITGVALNRGGYIYTRRIKALAEATRVAGLKF